MTVDTITLIGKESNRLEERSRGELTVDDLDERITTYDDHDEWYRIVLPALALKSLAVVAGATDLSERRVRDTLAARVLPHRSNNETLRALVLEQP